MWLNVVHCSVCCYCSGHTSISFSLHKQTLFLPCMCVCAGVRVYVTIFMNVSVRQQQRSLLKNGKMLKNKCEWDGNNSWTVCFCFLHAAHSQCYCRAQYTQSFTCTWDSIDKLLIAWAYVRFVCVYVCVAASAATGCLHQAFSFAQQNTNQITWLTLAAWDALFLLPARSRTRSPHNFLFWQVRVLFFGLSGVFCCAAFAVWNSYLMPWFPVFRRLHDVQAIQTERERIVQRSIREKRRRRKREKKKTLNMKMYSQAPKPSYHHPQKPWLSFSSHRCNCCNFDVRFCFFYCFFFILFSLSLFCLSFGFLPFEMIKKKIRMYVSILIPFHIHTWLLRILHRRCSKKNYELWPNCAMPNATGK